MIYTMDIIKNTTGFFLAFIAICMILILGPVSITYSAVKYFLSFRFKNAWVYLNKFSMSFAHSIDQTGNVVCQELFNDLFLKEKIYKFGNADETISSVLGKSKDLDDLNWLGKFIVLILDLIDPNHVEKASQHPTNN